MFCSNCGAQLPDDSKFCGCCGAQLDVAPAPAQPPQMTQPAPAQSPQMTQPAPKKPGEKGKIAGIAAGIVAVLALLALTINFWPDYREVSD